MILFDCETRPFSTGNQLPEVLFTGWKLRPGSRLHIHGSDFKTDEEVAGFNVAYDMGCLPDRGWAFDMYDKHKVLDLRINELLTDYAQVGQKTGTYSLDARASRAGFEHPCKESPWRTRYAELVGIDPSSWPDEAYQYLKADIDALEPLLAKEEMPDARAQSKYDFALKIVAANGMLVDQEAIDSLEKQYQLRVNWLRADLQEAGLIRAKGSKDMKVIQQAIADAGGTRRTKTGQLETSKSALRDLAPHAPVLSQLMKYNQASNILGREVKLLRSEPILHVRFDLAVSGRTTSRPNQQNFSKTSGIRQCFKPRPGHIYLKCDYPALELRTLAQVCNDLLGKEGELAKAFKAGADPHTLFADRFLGGLRQLAKAANFGFPGGLQGANFQAYAYDAWGLKVDDPGGLQRAWFRQWPEIPHYMRVAQRSGTWGTPLAHVRSGRLRGKASRTQKANTFFQGLGSDVAKATLYNLVRECEIGQLRGCSVVAFVHDEFLMEVPIEMVPRATEMFHDIIQESWLPWCPDVPLGELEVEVQERWKK